jgi:hypothetical protein
LTLHWNIRFAVFPAHALPNLFQVIVQHPSISVRPKAKGDIFLQKSAIWRRRTGSETVAECIGVCSRCLAPAGITSSDPPHPPV